MTSDIIPFEPDHINMMKFRDEEHLQGYSDKIAVYATAGLCYTLVVDGEIVCCSGIISPHSGVAEAWLVAGENFGKHGMIIGRTIKKFLDWVQPFYHRFQMSVLVGFTEAERFAEFLGFYKEGVMRKFDSKGNDYTLFARTV